jgi:hypothetical protein
MFNFVGENFKVFPSFPEKDINLKARIFSRPSRHNLQEKNLINPHTNGKIECPWGRYKISIIQENEN